MSSPVRFLTALGQAFSAMGLYASGHPARERPLGEAFQLLAALLEVDRHVRFSFLEDEVVFGDAPLREMKGWPPARRFIQAGVERMEFTAGLPRREFDDFLETVAVRTTAGRTAETLDPMRFRHIQFGLLSTDQEEISFEAGRELGKVKEFHEEATRRGRITVEVARSVVDTLTSAMRRESKLFLPLVPLKQTDQYTTVHSMNTSVLAIALGEFMHLSGPEVRVVGEAALLHDVGKVVVPPDILNKPGKLDDREWQEIVRHPVEGARILLNSGQGLEVAAVAAYEHHLRWDGGGYPDLKFKRPPHRVSQLVHLCDAYDAMRTKRPFQDPLPPDVIIDILLKGKGSNFDPDLVDLFVSMIRRWEERARGGTTARS
jgi:hypothetical protein